MDPSERLSRSTIRLDEAVVRLAERTAERLGVTVPQLVETLLLECADRAAGSPDSPPPPPRARVRARVIDLADARRRRAGDVPGSGGPESEGSER